MGLRGQWLNPVERSTMTVHDDNKPAPQPGRFCIVARMICGLLVGTAGLLWGAWLTVTGQEWEAILWMIATLACARFLAGSLYGYKG